MTLTVKLDASLEEQLRLRATSTGRTASDVVRAALQVYLALPEAESSRSAHALGVDLFGRHRGPADLSERRKFAAAEAWTARHARRGT